MSRFNTGNPLGSNDPRDLDDNAKNMDLAVNSDAPQWIDRFGRNRETFAGMESEFQSAQDSRSDRFNDFIASSGYQFVGDYGPGIEITEYNQLIRDSNGEFWRVSGQVALPYITTGAGVPEDDALVPAGDAVLRQDLANPGMGAAMVAYGESTVSDTFDMLKQRALNLDDFKTGANSDADALYDMLDFAKAHGIKNLNITRGIELDKKIRLNQDASQWLNDLSIDFGDHNVLWTGMGANSLSIGIIEVMGELTETSTVVVGDHAEFTSDLTVADTTGFRVGDWILIDSTSTEIQQIYLNHIVRIEEIVGNTFKTDTVRRLPVLPSIAPVQVTKVNPFDGLKIKGRPKFTASNQTSRDNGIGAVQFIYGVNSFAHIRSEKLWFKTFRAAHCARITAIADGRDPAGGGSGEGYTLQFEYTNHSLGKASGDSMRHAVDITAAWHNVFLDCIDFNSASASFSAHRAFEYNNRFVRCKSFDSKQAAFAFGTPMFGNHTDETYLIDCEAYGFNDKGVSFENMGRGLYIRGGVFTGKGYALYTSNNDTFVSGAKLGSGALVTYDTGINTGGVCEIIDSELLFATGLRSLNIVAGASATVRGGRISGKMTLGSATKLVVYGADVECPTSTALFDPTTADFTMHGGRLIIPAGSTVDQTLSVNSMDLQLVEFVQNNSLLRFILKGKKLNVGGPRGAGRFVFNDPATESLAFTGFAGSRISAEHILVLTGITGRVRLSGNAMPGSGQAIAVVGGSNIAFLSMVDNDIEGVSSIPSAQIQACVIKDNFVGTGSALPAEVVGVKIVRDNILAAP